MMVLMAGDWNIRDNTQGGVLIYKKVYGNYQGCVPVLVNTCGSISPYLDRPVPVTIPLADLELLAACAVVRLSLPDGCGSLARKPILRL